MEKLLSEIKKCEICKAELPLGTNPVVVAHPEAKLVIIGQAPGTKVHQTGIPWNDPSGRQLRKWLGMTDELFYDKEHVAIVPMGFCYPGKGKSGDLPPRPECASLWHEPLFSQMPQLRLTLLIGQYAQAYYLQAKRKKNLTETVRNYEEYLPTFFVLPHPSPRNRFWLKNNPWFELEILPRLKQEVEAITTGKGQ
ncbi:uracil-DNA glycosylase family protein [Flammeovirgaceae bacterium SG7u.111]|nr:uracil-DNA glycosylase family protein [Flammeovirgaceae bacterium SG7u.132]WPO33994.1 uracil-DNA glycosylase family protein [Flammeovirgaceae bacterium SG7u.111]